MEIKILDQDSSLYWNGTALTWGPEVTNLCLYDTLTSQWNYNILPPWKDGTSYTIDVTAYDNFGITDTDTETFYYECPP